ncbi:ATP-binding protein [Bacteriovoracaceae bacterium]|nr:ATP-binding protein [Bacteriovoracaceae bacterium]
MKNFSTTLKFTIYGSLFGLCFPLLGMWIIAIDQDLGFIETQFAGNSLLLIIDTAPLVLGFFAHLIGKRQENLENSLKLQFKEDNENLTSELPSSRKIIWQSLIVFLLLSSASFSLWMYLGKIKDINLDKTLTKLSEVQFDSSVQSLENLMLAMDRLTARYSHGLSNSQRTWELDTKSYLDDYKVFQAIEWANASAIVKSISPLKGNEKAMNLDLNFEEHRKDALSLSLEKRVGVFSSPIRLVQGGKGILSFHPTYDEDKHTGFIVGVYVLESLFEKYLKPNFEYSVHIGNEIVYESEGFLKKSISHFNTFQVRNLSFEINFHPSTVLVRENKDIFETTYIFIILFLISGALTFLYYSLQLKKEKLYLSREKLQETTIENDRISRMIQSLFDNAQGVIYRCDPNDNWTMRFINHQVEALSGYPVKDFIEDKVRSYASIIHPEDTEHVDRTVQEGVEAKSVFEIDYRVICKDGTTRSVHERGVPLFDDKGNCYALDGFIVDITQRKHLEEQLENEKIKSLQNAKLATLGEMAAGIAHEINNPLSIISNSIELLIKKGQAVDSENKFIKKIVKSVERMSKIVRGLKKFSRKTDEVMRAENSLQELITESIDLTIVKSNQKEVPIHLDPFEDVTVYCDDIQTEQVLINLINNAIDACWENEDKWVKIKVEESAQNLIKLVVIDAGKGINEENINQIFDPFFTTKTQSLGTGLGLSISKNIANEQGGDLTYEVREGNTAFIFTIPKAS